MLLWWKNRQLREQKRELQAEFVLHRGQEGFATLGEVLPFEPRSNSFFEFENDPLMLEIFYLVEAGQNKPTVYPYSFDRIVEQILRQQRGYSRFKKTIDWCEKIFTNVKTWLVVPKS